MLCILIRTLSKLVLKLLGFSRGRKKVYGRQCDHLRSFLSLVFCVHKISADTTITNFFSSTGQRALCISSGCLALAINSLPMVMLFTECHLLQDRAFQTEPWFPVFCGSPSRRLIAISRISPRRSFLNIQIQEGPPTQST